MNDLQIAFQQELENATSHLRLEILNELKQNETPTFDYWQSWIREGKTYDVNVFRHCDEIVFQVYPARSDGQKYETEFAEIQLNWHVWKAMAAAKHLPTHNVELTLSLRLNVSVQSLSPGEAIEQAKNQLTSGQLDILHALEHGECSAIITDDIPPIGDKCYTFNLLESLSKDVDIYASSLAEAEDHLKNHLDTHVKMSKVDSIGCEVLAASEEAL